MKTTAIALCIAAIAAAGLPSAAHDHATGVVKERMDMMTVIDKRTRAIAQRIKTKRDLAAIKADAEAIASHAPHITHLFPAGSTQPPTRAGNAIWQNWADFESKTRALEDASRTLAATTPNDAAALGAAAAAMMGTCDACHEKYRTTGRKGGM
jgi:cytochrome c556